MEDKLILQSNQLTKAVYKLTLNQKRFLMLGIANANDKGESTVSAGQLSDIFGLEKKEVNRIIKDERQKILASSLALDYINGQWCAVNWLQSIFYDGGNRYFVRFSTDLIPHIAELKNNFTLLSLSQAAKLKSVFAIRIYELACQYESKGVFYLTVKGIHERFKLAESYRKHGGLLESKVIKKSCTDITEKTDLVLNYRAVKKGRKIERFEFMVYRKATL